MFNRIKRRNDGIQTAAQFNEIVDQIAKEQLDIEADTAQYNAEKAAADKSFKLAKKEREASINNKLALAETYATEHRDTLLGDKQTSGTASAKFGFRKSSALKPLSSKWTMAKVIDTLKAAGKLGCVKVSETLDKPTVLKTIPEPELPEYGLRKEHREDFWIEPTRAEKTPDQRLKS